MLNLLHLYSYNDPIHVQRYFPCLDQLSMERADRKDLDLLCTPVCSRLPHILRGFDRRHELECRITNPYYTNNGARDDAKYMIM